MGNSRNPSPSDRDPSSRRPGLREGHGTAVYSTSVQDAPDIFSVEDATGNAFKQESASFAGKQRRHRLHRLGYPSPSIKGSFAVTFGEMASLRVARVKCGPFMFIARMDFQIRIM